MCYINMKNRYLNEKERERAREREREREIVHYKSLLNVLETVQSKCKDQAAADPSSYI